MGVDSDGNPGVGADRSSGVGPSTVGGVEVGNEEVVSGTEEVSP